MSFPIPFVAVYTDIDGRLFFYNPGEGSKVASVEGPYLYFRGMCGDRALIYPSITFDGVVATVELRSIDSSGVDRPFGVSVVAPSATALFVGVVNHDNPTAVVSYRDALSEPVVAVVSKNSQTTYMGEYPYEFQVFMDDLSILSSSFGGIS